MQALGLNNISTTLVRNTLGASTNKISELCTHDNINAWAKYKPANYGAGNNALSEVQPVGPATTSSGFRLGDFRKYDHQAQPPLFFAPASLNVSRYTDMPANEGLTGNILAINIDAPITGMRPTANNNGFNPDDLFYKSQNGTIRVRALLWNGSSYAATGTWIELTDPGWNEPIIILDNSEINVADVASGTYALHGEKQYYNANQWQTITNRFEGGDGSVVLYNGPKFTVTATISLAGALTYTVTRNNGSGNVNLHLTCVVTGDDTYTLTHSNAAPGTYNWAPTRPVNQNTEFIIKNNDTNFEYRRVQAFVPA